MTSKEKAKELVNKYKYHLDIEINNSGNQEQAKLYALILVNEMLNNFLPNKTTEYGRERYNFWQKVKHEISNL